MFILFLDLLGSEYILAEIVETAKCGFRDFIKLNKHEVSTLSALLYLDILLIEIGSQRSISAPSLPELCDSVCSLIGVLGLV